jgi:hypothetical protein
VCVCVCDGCGGGHGSPRVITTLYSLPNGLHVLMTFFLVHTYMSFKREVSGLARTLSCFLSLSLSLSLCFVNQESLSKYMGIIA